MADDEEVPDFDLLAMKKKKKKKPVADDTGAEGSSETAAADAEPSASDAAAGDDAGGGDEDDLDFGLGMKKKKKGKKKTAGEGEGDEDAGGDGDAGDDAGGDLDGDGFDLGKKKKKKKKPKAVDEDGDDDDGGDGGADAGEDLPLPPGAEDGDDLGVHFDDGGESSEPTAIRVGDTDRDYKYDELLSRMFQLLLANNPELAGDRKRFVMKPPQVVRDGAKKVVLVNFPEICKTMRRTSEHVFSFMLAELGTTGSIDGSGRMVIKGRFQAKAVEHVIRKYVSDYVLCQSCRSNDTDLHKENRLYFMQCNNCGARRSVAAITAGYKAQIGRRIRTG